MAQHQSALHRIRRDAKQSVRNHSHLSRVRLFIKKVTGAAASGDKAIAQTALSVAQSEIMKGVTKGVLHRNTAARKISRLNARVKKVGN